MKFVNSLIVLICLVTFSWHWSVWAQATGSVRLPETVVPPAPAETPVEKPAPTMPTPAQPTSPVQAAEQKAPGEEMVYLNVQDQDIKDVIRQISKATGKNFIIDDKVRGKVTIISEKMMTKEEAYQAFLSALEVAGFTVVTGPGGIIKIVALKDAISSPIPIHVDSTPYTDSYVTRLISLDNISATDMANAIKGLVSKSGNLFAYPATNTLIITDSGTNIDRLMKLIKELDQEGPQEIVEIIPIVYANAVDIADKILQLFELGKAGGGAGTAGVATATARRGGAAAAARPGAAGGDLEEVQAVSKIIADERTNSIIVLASKRSVDRVKTLIAKLDTPLQEGETGTMHVHYLKYAKATDLAATLSAMTSGAGAAPSPVGGAGGAGGAAAAAASKKGKASAVARFEGGISIAADEATNALIITATARDYDTLVADLISKLDIPRRQVYLEAVVMELTMAKAGEYSVTAYGGGGNGSVLGFGQTFGAAASLFDPQSFFSTGGLLGGALGRDTVSITTPTTSGGTQTVTIPAFSAFLNMIQTYSDTNVVSTPNILTLDNEEAEINVTRKEYATSATSTSTGVITTTPTPLEAGLTLKITPQITEGDVVRLKIQHELSNFEERQKNEIASPTRSRKINATVMAADGQTVVLGGLMQDEVLHAKSKVPLLGDIPILGWLFRTSKSTTKKSNMLVFLTPHIIRDPEDFSSVLKRKIDQRNEFVADNYGKKQQEAIRDVIRTHRADLLDYVPPEPAPPKPLESSSTPANAAKSTRTKGTSTAVKEKPALPPLPPKNDAVITVPSPDAQMRKNGGEISRAYPSSTVVESSSGKSVESSAGTSSKSSGSRIDYSY